MNQTRIFRDLHSNPARPLILPNIWDAGGARLLESLGAPAVATTSAGVAWSHGYPDGNVLPARLQAQLAEEVVRAVKVPVSIDVEAGYADEPAAVVENLKPVVAAGIAGINIEDGTGAPAVLTRKIEAIKKMASAEGVDLFINARTDVYLQDLVADEAKVNETLSRAVTYQKAGADGLFVPGLTDTTEIVKITQGTGLPVNLMASPDLPKADALARLNVRRLSAGTGLSKIVFHEIARLAANFLQEGNCGIFAENAMPFAEIQKLFAERK